MFREQWLPFIPRWKGPRGKNISSNGFHLYRDGRDLVGKISRANKENLSSLFHF